MDSSAIYFACDLLFVVFVGKMSMECIFISSISKCFFPMIFIFMIWQLQFGIWHLAVDIPLSMTVRNPTPKCTDIGICMVYPRLIFVYLKLFFFKYIFLICDDFKQAMNKKESLIYHAQSTLVCIIIFNTEPTSNSKPVVVYDF